MNFVLSCGCLSVLRLLGALCLSFVGQELGVVYLTLLSIILNAPKDSEFSQSAWHKPQMSSKSVPSSPFMWLFALLGIRSWNLKADQHLKKRAEGPSVDLQRSSQRRFSLWLSCVLWTWLRASLSQNKGLPTLSSSACALAGKPSAHAPWGNGTAVLARFSFLGNYCASY